MHEYLAYENKKILTLMPLKSQVRLRLARVRFSTGHFAWIFSYFLQMIFLAKAVIWFCFTDEERNLSLHEVRNKSRNTLRLAYGNFLQMTRLVTIFYLSANFFLANAVIWFFSMTSKRHHAPSTPKMHIFSQNTWQKIVRGGRMKS